MKVCFLFVTLCLALAQASIYHTPLNCPLNHINYDPRFGFLEEVETRDEFECMAACEGNEECVAYNIELPDLVCEFNDDQTNEYGDDMITRDGWTYWEKLETAESNTCDNNYLSGRKQREVTSRGVHTHVLGRGGTWAWWGKDTKNASDPRIYYVPDYSNREDLYEYQDEVAFRADNNYVMHYYNPRSQANQNLVYNRMFWYREYDVRRLIVWNLEVDAIEATVSVAVMGPTYGPQSSQCQYDWGGHSSHDLEVDEMGRIYMIWGDNLNDCSLRISVIDTDMYRVVKTYGIEGMFKSWGGGGFIVDDIYYMTDNYNSDPTWIMVEWNFRNSTTFFRQTGTEGIANAVKWVQPHGYNAHMHWNPVEQLLYASHNAQHYRSELTFREIP